MISISKSSSARRPAAIAEQHRCRPCSARWIDLGHCAAEDFHAAYVGLARSQARESAPIVLWAIPAAHVCIGQSQNRDADIVADPGVPVVTRALGGGAVWVDEAQHCVVLIARAADANRDRLFWARWALQPALETMRSFGLPAVLCERDIWVRGRKIAGSGAAIIGECALLGFSFMRHFARERFAAAITLPHEGLRTWLRDGLRASVTDWASEACPPAGVELCARFRRQLRNCLGWRMRDSSIRSAESRAIAAVRAERDGDWVGSVPSRSEQMVKLNARSWLIAQMTERTRRDFLIVDGRVVRTAVHGCRDD